MKCLQINLDYDLAETDQKDQEGTLIETVNQSITRNLIVGALQINHQKMGAKLARQFRSIDKSLKKAIDTKSDKILVSDSDFDTIYNELYSCEISPQLAYFLPILLDEVDKIKNRNAEEESILVKEIMKSQVVDEKVRNVVEMSKKKEKEA